MLRTFTLAALVFSSLSGVAAPTTGYFEVCGKPSKLGPFVGPKFMAIKSPEFGAALSLIQASHSAYTVESLTKAVKGGVFASSPYVLSDVKLQEKLENICIMFSTSGAASGVADAIQRNANVSNVEERNRAIDDALDTSDIRCFQEARKIDRDRDER